jgi:iron-sulfur cluster repair protein YtfE (RIC family)
MLVALAIVLMVLAHGGRLRAQDESPRHWKAESLKDLIRYIVEVHHAYLRSELPSLARDDREP